jgi:hypothetical protein
MAVSDSSFTIRQAGSVHYCQSCDEPMIMERVASSARCPRCGRLDELGPDQPLFVVTGASGSGKTAVFIPLARRLSGSCLVFDVDLLIDSASALAGGPIVWPAFRDAWLGVAHGVAMSGLPTLLLGPLIPEHLDGLPARRWIGEIHFLLLDCPDTVRRERLEARPVWRLRDVAVQTEFGQGLRRLINDKVDTSRGTPEDVASTIAEWVHRHLADG